jgi:hypothetical protein
LAAVTRDRAVLFLAAGRRVVAALVRDADDALGFFFETDLVAIFRLLSIDSTRAPVTGYV